MKKKFLRVWIPGGVVLSLLLWIPASSDSLAGRSDDSTRIDNFVPHQLLVRFEESTKAAVIQKTYMPKKYSREIQSLQDLGLWGWHLMQLNEGCDLLDMKNSLLRDGSCRQVEFNYTARVRETIPNDELFSYQYSLKNIGQYVFPPTETENYSGRTGADIKATEGWDWSTGNEEVIVAVIDTGVASKHEDLKNKLVPGINVINENKFPEDDHISGHGTAVASIISAETNNGFGMAGVAWHAKIMPIKAFNQAGVSDSTRIATAIYYAVNNNARIINMSFSLNGDSELVKTACKVAFEKGCILVAAAGDHDEEAEESPQVQYPAAYDSYCLAVGATDANDQLWPKSNYGPQLDLVAPGMWILTADFDPETPENLRSYKNKSGTSFSAAIVSGAAALLVGYKPFLSNVQVMKLLCYTADDVNQEIHPKKDQYMGYGRINLHSLLSPYILEKSDAQLPEG